MHKSIIIPIITVCIYNTYIQPSLHLWADLATLHNVLPTQKRSKANWWKYTDTGYVTYTQGRRSLTMQKYRMTLECWSDSLSSSTSLSANVKHSGSRRFTATSRLSNLPLKIQETDFQNHCLIQEYEIKIFSSKI